MMKRRVAVFAVAVLARFSVAAQTVTIDHQAVACAVAEKFPQLHARLLPSDGVAAARVLFQGENRQEWYSVAMKAEKGDFVGVLPKPKKSLKSFRYYIEVTDKAIGVNRTAEYTTNVVGSAGECNGKITAATLGTASVLLQGPAGLAALPAGFASSGVVTAGTAAGSTASATGAASGAAGAGGGLGATALVVGGLAVAGGAVAVGAAKGGGEDGNGNSNGPTSPQLFTYGVSFIPIPGVDMSACAGTALSWSSQRVSQVDTNGNFNETWAPNQPNTARIAGQVTATTFQATLSCTNGARSGTISATGANGSYSGTFDFGPSRGQVAITRSP